jgi:uncharacterized membrane protein YjjP (DUF1212 family)
MKNEKLKVITYNEDGTVKAETNFKSFRDISSAYGLTYHDVREINRICDNIIKKKYTHSNITNLLTKIKIFSIQPIYNI